MKRFKIWRFWIILAFAFMAIYFYLPKYLGDTVYPLKYEDLIKKYAKEYSVDASLIAAVILQESRFNPSAVSAKGATGLMQIMPATGQGIASTLGVRTYSLKDPETSIRFGTFYLKDKLTKYNGDLDAVLSSYNAGSGNTDTWIRLNILDNIPFKETNEYVKKVKNYQKVYATMYKVELELADVSEFVEQKTESTESQIRGFVWSEIFGGIFNVFNKESLE